MIQQIARLFYPYGSTRRVLRGPAQGMRFVVGDGIASSYALGRGDAAPDHFNSYVKPGMTVYDVGGNKGQMALIYAALVGPTGRVVSFEPAPAEYACLSDNVALNGLANVRTVQAAASDSEGELVFTYHPDRPTQGKLLDVETTYENHDAERFPVPTLPLDSVLDSEPMPDFMKIDVEGAAASVLRGATRILEEGSPRFYMELHGPEEQAGVRDEVLSRGYIATTLDGERVNDPAAAWKSPLWCFKP